MRYIEPGQEETCRAGSGHCGRRKGQGARVTVCVCVCVFKSWEFSLQREKREQDFLVVCAGGLPALPNIFFILEGLL